MPEETDLEASKNGEADRRKSQWLALVTRIDEDELYRLAREGYQENLDNEPGLMNEFPVPFDQVILVDRHIEVRFAKAWGATVEVRIDFRSTADEDIGYYALVLEEDFSVQDDFFVIRPKRTTG